MNVAIDGPAGAGKSTIAKLCAKKMDLIYVDTGAMYRAVALYLLESGIDVNDRSAVAEKCKGAGVDIKYEDGIQNVYLNGTNVTGRLREEAVGNTASVTSAVPEVRAQIFSLQRGLAERGGVIMDGRDIGTVVMPDADVKIYLTASSEVRAKRRVLELEAKGEHPDFEEIKKDIEERDRRDMTREISPLKQADDAILVDTSDMTIEEVVEKISSICK
ncbi:MAG: (d)CMP kinase [Lachnospiraceae bacterium]|nr:(d)CMP kinase [Lachnospiraceae bacterium]MBO7363054.1 (d)CMP kinase [Lachnospiraceae bacterium]MBP5253733.1 (d)CMP kinase [Lachnospiraceae bacterium]MBP5471823.1 (d)CMP kinase [Lachnospiraceae bacterium]MBP5702851.1 (d)CMP kinase [Lachnospiraceae bacterium]